MLRNVPNADGVMHRPCKDCRYAIESNEPGKHGYECTIDKAPYLCLERLGMPRNEYVCYDGEPKYELMKVGELIEKLSEHNPEATVEICIDGSCGWIDRILRIDSSVVRIAAY